MLTIAWLNSLPLQEGAVGIAGRYGTPAASDYYIDHHQPSAVTGQCWNWYSYIPKDDAQPLKMYTRIDGLWPDETYCLYTMFKGSRGGWSQPTEVQCLTASWDSSWGAPASPH